jgi:hypothetical protein
MDHFGEKVAFIWSVADLLRDAFKRSKYPDVILPFTVLRRIDCVLEPTKQAVLAAHARLKGRLENLAPQLRKASGFAFYNTSPFTFESLCGDAKHLAANLRNYVNSFSDNMREVVEKFDFHNTVAKLEEAGLLFLVTERFKNIDLHPDKVSNLEIGYVFEELIRKFNEAMDENPGEHFTPREVIRLMVNLLLARDSDALAEKHVVRTVYDPCCGSGGMLTIAKERIQEINQNADVHLFGQEVNPETFAVCKSDLPALPDEGAGGGRQPGRHRHEQLAPVHRRCRGRRERNPPLDSGERLAGNHRRAARAAFLQHRHPHLRLGSDQPQAEDPQRQGATDRCHGPVDPHAAKPGRQAARDQPGADRREHSAVRGLPGGAAVPYF